MIKGLIKGIIENYMAVNLFGIVLKKVCKIIILEVF